MAIYRGPGGAGDATVDATNAAALVAIRTQEATDAATAAAASAAEAAASAVIASDGLDGIAAYAAAAAGSAADALASEVNAADSEANAAISEANANEDAGTASTKANEASDSADAAALSASNAATSASNAATSASNAASSASSASNSATNAANSATSAAASAASTAGYLPSSTGNTGKYLRTNGTTNYWDVVDALPSQTGNNGKYLTTNGTSTSWAVVADPDAATPLVDGLVYGQTDSTNATWSGTITNNGSYLYYADYGNYNISFAASSAVGIAAAAGNVVVGQGITINDGTTTRDFGVITAVTVADPTYITTSLQPYGNPLIDSRYCATMVLTGTNGGNVGLGYNIFDSLNNGDNNTVIGHNAGGSIINGNNNIVIGYNADASSTSVSNEATIGNSDITKTRLFGALAVGGSSTGTSGQVLTSQGSGSAPIWSNAGGTVTSVALSAPTGLTVSGSPVTTSGTLALTYTSGYSIPTTSSQTNWDTAYGWGNHASAGYLTGITSGQVTGALGYTPENSANKNASNGYAGLDSSGLVPSSILPSYVDDVLEYANLASFPGTGATGKIYVALDTNKTYRWSGSAYIEISASPGSTDAVTEGSTNLYFTNARARSAISATGSLSYNSSTGVFSYTQPTNVSTFTNDSGYITSSALSPYLTSATAASTYAPLTGTGTSGTWGISVTGNAATATTAANQSGGTVAATTGSFSGALTLSGGTANGVAYLNGSKVLTTGSALTFDGTNLGLGVTPSAWATVGPVFQANQASITGYNNQAIFSANWYYNAGNKYITTGYATQYSQSSGQHIWYNAPSGTAGNAITFTQAMTLDASGNLGIGTSSPGYKLDVSGIINNSSAIYWGAGVGKLNFSGSDAYIDATGSTIFRTGGSTERFRIDSTGAFGLSGANYGTSGQVLTSNGSGAAPTWTTPSGSGNGAQVQPISASIASNAITVSASSLALDFRSTTLTSGTITRVTGTPSNLTISSTDSFGLVTASGSQRIVILAINNAGTIELAASALYGGLSLDETGTITTATSSTTSTGIKSTTARSGVAYRVIGFIDATFTTATGWGSLALVQGQGGEALSAMQSLGYGQTYQNMTASRALATTYYNTTSRPIFVFITAQAASGNTTYLTPTIGGVAQLSGNTYCASASYGLQQQFIVPPGQSYSVTGQNIGTVNRWLELR